jgi:preprotein translocase subunit YajC
MSITLKIKTGASSMSTFIMKVFMPLAKSSLLITLLIAGTADMLYAMAGPPGGGAGQPQGPGAMFSSFLPLILIFVIFYFLLIRPQSKKAKEHKQMLENLKKGDKIMTNGGIHGIIDDMDGETLTLKIGVGSDLKVKVSRGHIAAIRGKE